MLLDRVHGDPESIGDQPRGQPLEHQLKYLFLTSRERWALGHRRGLRVVYGPEGYRE